MSILLKQSLSHFLAGMSVCHQQSSVAVHKRIPHIHRGMIALVFDIYIDLRGEQNGADIFIFLHGGLNVIIPH